MSSGLCRCIKYSFAYVSVFRDGIYVPWKTFWHACDMLHLLLINESWPMVFIELVIMVYQNMFLCRRKQHIQKRFWHGGKSNLWLSRKVIKLNKWSHSLSMIPSQCTSSLLLYSLWNGWTKEASLQQSPKLADWNWVLKNSHIERF